MIELGEKREGGLTAVIENTGTHSRPLGDIARLQNGEWLAIPDHYRNLPLSVHKLRRGAIEVLAGRKQPEKGTGDD